MNNYTNVYQAMNLALKYYKKYSQQNPLNENAAYEEAKQIASNSPVRQLQQALLFAVMDQLGREQNVTNSM